MRNDSASPYIGRAARSFTGFSKGIQNCLGVCRSCSTNSSYRSFQDKYQLNCNGFPALCPGRLFCMSLFLFRVIISLVCCDNYWSTVFSLSKQMLTWKNGLFRLYVKAELILLLSFRSRSHSKNIC